MQTTREIALSSPASPIPEHRRKRPVSRPHVDGAGPTVASIARFELDCGALLDVFLIALPRRNMEEQLIAVVGSQKSESTILVVELVFSCRHISSLVLQLFGVCLVVSIPRPHAVTLEFDFWGLRCRRGCGFFSCAFKGALGFLFVPRRWRRLTNFWACPRAIGWQNGAHEILRALRSVRCNPIRTRLCRNGVGRSERPLA